MERVMGIEPTSKAWEALVLPLNYARESLFCDRIRRNKEVAQPLYSNCFVGFSVEISETWCRTRSMLAVSRPGADDIHLRVFFPFSEGTSNRSAGRKMRPADFAETT